MKNWPFAFRSSSVFPLVRWEKFHVVLYLLFNVYFCRVETTAMVLYWKLPSTFQIYLTRIGYTVTKARSRTNSIHFKYVTVMYAIWFSSSLVLYVGDKSEIRLLIPLIVSVWTLSYVRQMAALHSLWLTFSTIKDNSFGIDVLSRVWVSVNGHLALA